MPQNWLGLGRMSSRLMLLASTLSIAGCATTQTNVATATPGARQTIALAAPASATRVHNFRAHRPVPRSFDGIASFYSEGARVATGASFNPNNLTAAHPSLPFGTKVRVSDPKTQRSVVVTINDRGPYVHGRVLDLSLGAARALGIQNRGVTHVHAEVM
jgi:rare lipoprotein A